MKRNLWERLLWGAAVAVLSATTITVAPSAEACGGTFCDNPGVNQPPMPVDQEGENILFSLRDGHVEAHVQIQYTGDPERFAWVVPVPATPELYVGSERLFQNMLSATVPTFALTNQSLACGSNGVSSRSSSAGCGSFGAQDEAVSLDGTGGPTQDSDEREIFQQQHQSVGVFDITIIEAQSAADVTAWLVANNFLDEPEAPAIIDDYVAQGYKFVAVKLTPGAGVDEIHPLVLRYPGSEPCIPLKLTRVAAVDDMGVRAFFFGDGRVVPTGNFYHVEPNELLYDWINFGDNYRSVVSAAVDAEPANGRAFMTEYAGPASVVPLDGVFSSDWSAEALQTLPPEQVVAALTSQGLMSCQGGGACEVLHPLLLPILREHLPAPDGVLESDFYACVSCYLDQFDPNAFDAAALAADFQALIVDPGLRASTMVTSSPYLTRLFTTISPDEMTEDPTFAEAAGDWSDVDNRVSAQRTLRCSGASTVDTSSHQVWLEFAGSWPAWPIDIMPATQLFQQFSADGSLMGSLSNDDTIGDIVDDWNSANKVADPRSNGGAGDVNSDDGGCLCRANGRTGGRGGYFFLFAFGLAMFRRLRRRAG